MIGKLEQQLQEELAGIKDAGLYKEERIIVSPQGAEVKMENGDEVVIMCANNYLGLSSHPKVIDGAK
jgi:glycine C-acetyltransferase